MTHEYSHSVGSKPQLALLLGH